MSESAPNIPDTGKDSNDMARRVVAARYMENVMQEWDGTFVLYSKGVKMGRGEIPHNLNPEYLGDPYAREIIKIIRTNV